VSVQCAINKYTVQCCLCTWHCNRTKCQP